MKFEINGKVVEVSNEDLTKAIEEKSESIAISNEDLVIRTKEEDSSYKTNVHEGGVTAGTEIGRKNVIKALGIEGDGLHKSDDVTIKALQDWSSSKVTLALEESGKAPDEKVVQLESDIETLRGTISTLTTEKEDALNMHTEYKKKQTITSTLSSLIPDNVIIDKSDMLTLIGTKIKADINENGVVYAIGADGQPLKNSTTLEPLPIKEVVTSFFDSNKQYLSKPDGGAGGIDSEFTGKGKQSVEEFIKEMGSKGISPNSEDFNTEMSKRQKAGTIDL
jgi:hypothetical protein